MSSVLSLPNLDAPAFGDPCPVAPAPAVLEFLSRRRSASAQALETPGPDPAQLSALITLAARAPDHGKLAPWRFVILQGAAKAELVRRLDVLADLTPNPDKARAALQKLARPPVTVLVISSPRGDAKPVWEQELSAGAVCTLMLVAAGAMGYGANWITDWYAYKPEALRLLGVADGERVAGFIHMGTPAQAPQERVRPDLAPLTSQWMPPPDV